MDGHSSSGPVAVLLLAALTSSALGQGTTYTEHGTPLVLTPPKHKDVITSVVWTHNSNMVVEWVNNEKEFYKSFKGRTDLDQSTAKLTVNNATQSDAGEYKVEINKEQQPQVYKVAVIKKVPKPMVVVRTPACGPTSRNCNFTCQGDTAGTEPLTYSWRKVDPDGRGELELGPQTINLLLEEVETKRVKQISCRMKNPVSEEKSEPLDNPMYLIPVPPSPVGLVLGISFLIIIVGVLAGLVFWKREAIKTKLCPDSDTSGEVGSSALTERDGSPSVNQPLKENPN